MLAVGLKRSLVPCAMPRYLAEYYLRGWHLLFEQKRTIVTVTSNGTDDYLEWKFIPAEIIYKSLRTMMDFNKVTDWDKEDDNLEIKWLY